MSDRLDQIDRDAGLPVIKLIPASEFAKRKPQKALIKNLVQGEIGVAYGDSNSGKTAIVQKMAFAIAGNENFAGLRTQHGAVAHLLGEGTDGISARLRAREITHGDLPDDYFVIPGPINLLADDHVIRLGGELCSIKNLRLIVIDTLASNAPGIEENGSADMSSLVDKAKMLNRMTGATVLFIHHSGKDPSKGLRGHTSLKAAIDFALEIRKNHDKTRTLRVTKARDFLDDQELTFVISSVVVGEDDDGEIITAPLAELTDAPKHEKPKDQPRGAWQKAVLAALRRLEWHNPGGTDIAELLSAAVQSVPHDSNATRDRRRESAARALQELVTSGFAIEVSGTLVRLPSASAISTNTTNAANAANKAQPPATTNATTPFGCVVGAAAEQTVTAL